MTKRRPAPNRLRVCRAECRVSQMDLAAKARLSLTRYWRIENGYAEPSEEEQRRLAAALKTTIEQAFPAVRVEATS